MRHSVPLAATVWLVGVLSFAISAEQQARRPPNIVIIFADDLGYGDVGVYGAKGFATPNLDRMAREGIRFTDFHVAQAVCSASRAALLTGCYPNRIGIHGAGDDYRHLPNDRATDRREAAVATDRRPRHLAGPCG